jgi:hypothetical protein
MSAGRVPGRSSEMNPRSVPPIAEMPPVAVPALIGVEVGTLFQPQPK